MPRSFSQKNKRARTNKAKKATKARWSAEFRISANLEDGETILSNKEGNISDELDNDPYDIRMIEEAPIKHSVMKVDAETNTDFQVIDVDLATLLKKTRKKKVF